ncbi:acyl carrier protein [Sphingopyxis fribergensis]|jgi:acyl carrier protein
MSDFRSGLAEILEVEAGELEDGFELGELWDSLAVVSTLALIDEVHDVSVSAEDLAECQTVGDIRKLVDAAVA